MAVAGRRLAHRRSPRGRRCESPLILEDLDPNHAYTTAFGALWSTPRSTRKSRFGVGADLVGALRAGEGGAFVPAVDRTPGRGLQGRVGPLALPLVT
jgi:hypothetical protein